MEVDPKSEITIPEAIVRVVCKLMGHFIERQQIVVRLMVRLRPDLIKQYGIDTILGIDIEPYLRALDNIEQRADSLDFLFNGIWNNVWQWKLHGIGCRLMNLQTGELFDWDAGHPYELSDFWYHLDWRIRNEPQNADIQRLLRWQAEHQLAGSEFYLRIEHYMRELHILSEQKLDDHRTLLLPEHFAEGRIC
jgi:hypothetical protein